MANELLNNLRIAAPLVSIAFFSSCSKDQQNGLPASASAIVDSQPIQTKQDEQQSLENEINKLTQQIENNTRSIETKVIAHGKYKIMTFYFDRYQPANASVSTDSYSGTCVPYTGNPSADNNKIVENIATGKAQRCYLYVTNPELQATLKSRYNSELKWVFLPVLDAGGNTWICNTHMDSYRQEETEIQNLKIYTQELMNRLDELRPQTSQPKSTQYTNNYTGTIGNSTIHLNINIENNSISGHYYYDRFKKKIPISGKKSGVNDFRFSEYVNDLCTGNFQLEMGTHGNLVGTWTDPNSNKVYDVDLVPDSM